MSSLRKRVAAALLAALALSCTAALVACGGSGRDVSGRKARRRIVRRSSNRKNGRTKIRASNGRVSIDVRRGKRREMTKSRGRRI